MGAEGFEPSKAEPSDLKSDFKAHKRQTQKDFRDDAEILSAGFLLNPKSSPELQSIIDAWPRLPQAL
jgi:hypothetical protein